MGSKYRIIAFNYPYKGYYDVEYQTDSFVKFIVKLIFWNFKYFGVDGRIRDGRKESSRQ